MKSSSTLSISAKKIREDIYTRMYIPRSNLIQRRYFNNVQRTVQFIILGAVLYTEWTMHLAAPTAIDILWLNVPIGVILLVHRFTVAYVIMKIIKPRYISLREGSPLPDFPSHSNRFLE